MSLITLVLIKGLEITILNNHYEAIITIIKNNFKEIKKGTPTFQQPLDLDAGYILIDVNTQTVVSCQSAFHKQHIPTLKDWTWVEY